MAQDEEDNPGPETPEINATTYGGEERNGGDPLPAFGGGGGGANSHSEPGLYPPLKDTALSQNGYGAGLGFRVCLVFFPPTWQGRSPHCRVSWLFGV